MDGLIHIEVLNRHGEVAFRHATRTLPVRIGRAYDNDLILEDPYVGPYHAVVERTPAGELELVDAGSRNGLFRASSQLRLVREQVDPAARYRAGKTEFRIRSSAHPVVEERIDRPAGALREPLAAALAVLAVVAILFFDAWSGSNRPVWAILPG
jgi:pSer/pThr/pTyr-binding forkhead associated (FHA) protein